MNIKILAMDVDGTLTDGKVYIADKGEFMKAFDIKDGYGISILKDHGIIPVIITSRISKIVAERAKELKVEEVHQDVADKLDTLTEIARKYNLSRGNVAYIGDDLNDIDCLNWCGLSACPNDAMDEVKRIVDYQCSKNGGNGAVREFIGFILKKEYI